METLESFLAQILTVLGTFSPLLVVLLFLMCFIGEGLGFSIPALLETVWLTTGYQFIHDNPNTPFYYVLSLLITAQAGRQLGSLLFFYLSRVTRGPLLRLTHFLHLGKVVTKSSALINKVNLFSPFSVATGRLLGLRVPITIVLGANKKLKVNALGILISSAAFDGTYLIIGGIVGTTPVISPYYIILFFLAGVALLWGLTFAAKRSSRLLLNRFWGHRKAPGDASADEQLPNEQTRGDQSPPQD